MKAEEIITQPKYKSLKNLVLICEAMDEFSEEKDRRIRELTEELVKCEKTFGLIWQIFGTLENAHCDDLRHLVDNIEIDIPLIQARIKDTLNPPKP